MFVSEETLEPVLSVWETLEWTSSDWENLEWVGLERHHSWLLPFGLSRLSLRTVLVELCSAAGAAVMLLQPVAEATLVERVPARQHAALVTIRADLLEADVAISFLAFLQWWQLLKEVFADSAALRFFFTVLEGEEHWLAHSLEHALEGVLSLTKVHVDVVQVVDVDSWLINVLACSDLRLVHGSAV